MPRGRARIISQALSSTKEDRIKHTKRYHNNAWDIVKTLTVPIKLQDLIQLSPTAKGQIRNGLTSVKPEFIQEETINKLEVKNKKKALKKSSAYIQVTLNGKIFQGIVNTGAGPCVVSYNVCQLLGWIIDATR